MKWLTVLLAGLLWAQQQPPSQFPLPTIDPAEPPVEFVCPMDPDVRSKGPAKCSRCGMALVPGIPDPLEFPVELKLSPAAPKPGQKFELAFQVRHPKTGKRVTGFDIMHE